MIKTHWVKTAAVCGTALTLALAAGSVRVDTNAATMCKETEMAGLSSFFGTSIMQTFIMKRNRKKILMQLRRRQRLRHL